MGALGAALDPLLLTCRPGGLHGFDAAILCPLARLAAFGRVAELFLYEERLFAGCPGKRLGTIDAVDRDILEVAIAGGRRTKKNSLSVDVGHGKP